MASGFAASDAIAGHLLQTWWFIVPFVVATLVFIVLAGRFIKRL